MNTSLFTRIFFLDLQSEAENSNRLLNFGFFLGACIASLVGVAYKKQKDSTITSTHVQQNTQMKRIKGLHIKFTEEQKALICPTLARMPKYVFTSVKIN